MGVVARDSCAKFLAANSEELHFVADPFMTEAYVLRDGLNLAQFLGSNKFIIQSSHLQLCLMIVVFLLRDFEKLHSSTVIGMPMRFFS